MSQNKNNNTVWNTRIKKKTSNIFKKVGSSIEVDKRLYKEDILASVSHAEMLYKQKIITINIKDKILWGLKRIQNEIEKKNFKFDENLEDKKSIGFLKSTDRFNAVLLWTTDIEQFFINSKVRPSKIGISPNLSFL